MLQEDKILKQLKEARIYPESGYGSVTINVQGHKIVNVEKKESIKLSEERRNYG